MDSVDIIHGLRGHCQWTEWTLFMDSVDIVPPGLSGQCPWTQWTLSMDSVDIVYGPWFQYSSWTMSMDNVHRVHGLSTDGQACLSENLGSLQHTFLCKLRFHARSTVFQLCWGGASEIEGDSTCFKLTALFPSLIGHKQVGPQT